MSKHNHFAPATGPISNIFGVWDRLRMGSVNKKMSMQYRFSCLQQMPAVEDLLTDLINAR